MGWFMPAEWCRHAATWMVWPHNKALWENGWGVTLPQVQQDFARVVNAIARFEPVNLVVDPAAQTEARALCGDGVRFIPLPVDDSWCRDSGPTFICHPELGTARISWRFNAWGGKSAHGLDEGLARRVLNSLELECIGSFLANEGAPSMWMGGHPDHHGVGCCSTANRNPGMTKVEIERIFSRLLGIEKTIWLPGIPDHVTGDMTDGHVDGVCTPSAARSPAGGRHPGRALHLAAWCGRIAEPGHRCEGRSAGGASGWQVEHGGRRGGGPCASYTSHRQRRIIMPAYGVGADEAG